MAQKFDYLIVGAGLYGAVFARLATDFGKKCLVVDRRDHIAGNIYTEKVCDIDVHCYGAHIFHTSDERVWNFVRRFATFNHFVNAPIANFHGRLFNLPFNMNTFYALWGVKTPQEAQDKIAQQVRDAGICSEPQNLEEQAICLVGTDIYETLIKGYTEKQWGRSCRDLPASIIRRLPVRMTFDNNYFRDPFQGIPVEGYTAFVDRLLTGSEVRLGVDYLKDRAFLDPMAKKVVFTGPIDEYFGFSEGVLKYRSVRFETEVMDTPNYQGVAVVNFTDRKTPFTRIIEHKHFVFGDQPVTVISREYPNEWAQGEEPYYPINDTDNSSIYKKYQTRANMLPNIIFGGRLGTYQYLDMDKVIAQALADVSREFASEVI